MLPPSMVMTLPVVFSASAVSKNPLATSVSNTSVSSRLLLKYSSGVKPRAVDLSASTFSVKSLVRIRSALTAFERIPSLP